MKKLILIVLSLLIIASLAGCKPGGKPSETGDKETLAELYKVVKSEEGRWVSMIQANNYYLDFIEKDGKYLVQMIDHDFDKNTDTTKNYEAVDASFNKETSIYTVRLIEEGSADVNLVIHVDTKTVSKNELYAECVFKDNNSIYYIFEKYAQDDPEPLIDFFELVREDEGRWSQAAGPRDFYILFRLIDGKHMASLIEFDSSNYYFKELDYEVDGYDYNEAEKTFIVQLKGDSNYTLHVNVSNLDNMLISAENPFDGNKIIEYIFVEKDGVRSFISEGNKSIGFSDRYLPNFRLMPDGTFVFVENMASRFAVFGGTYTEDSNQIVMTLTEKEALKNSDMYKINQIVFKKQADGKLVLDTNLAISWSGDKFFQYLP